MSQELFLCFECNAKNRVPDKSDQAKAKCGKCGAPLFPSEEDNDKSETKSKPKNTPSDSNSSSASPNFSIWLPVIVIAAIVIIPFLVGQNNSKPSSTTPKAIASSQAVSLPSAINQRAGALWNRTGQQAVAPFVIQTPAGKNYFIKLIDSSTGLDAMAIYVIGGRYLEVLVPLGFYKIEYTSGEKWYGEKHYFGQKPNAWQQLTDLTGKTKIFNFKRNFRGTIKLTPVQDGNLKTKRIYK